MPSAGCASASISEIRGTRQRILTAIYIYLHWSASPYLSDNLKLGLTLPLTLQRPNAPWHVVTPSRMFCFPDKCNVFCIVFLQYPMKYYAQIRIFKRCKIKSPANDSWKIPSFIKQQIMQYFHDQKVTHVIQESFLVVPAWTSEFWK
jgi:hypothetical protein